MAGKVGSLQLPALDGVQLSPVDSVESLGMWLDSSLVGQTGGKVRVFFFYAKPANKPPI